MSDKKYIISNRLHELKASAGPSTPLNSSNQDTKKSPSSPSFRGPFSTRLRSMPSITNLNTTDNTAPIALENTKVTHTRSRSSSPLLDSCAIEEEIMITTAEITEDKPQGSIAHSIKQLTKEIEETKKKIFAFESQIQNNEKLLQKTQNLFSALSGQRNSGKSTDEIKRKYHNTQKELRGYQSEHTKLKNELMSLKQLLGNLQAKRNELYPAAVSQRTEQAGSPAPASDNNQPPLLINTVESSTEEIPPKSQKESNLNFLILSEEQLIQKQNEILKKINEIMQTIKEKAVFSLKKTNPELTEINFADQQFMISLKEQALDLKKQYENINILLQFGKFTSN